MANRANVFAIHSWDGADDCRRMEALLRASDPDLAHYSLPPERALEGTTAQIAASVTRRIEFATAVVVLNTPGLHRRTWSSFEMRTAVALRKRIVVVQPHGEFQQPVPAVLDGEVYRYATWRSHVVGRAIRGEYPCDGRVFDLAEDADRRRIVSILAAGVTFVSLVTVCDAIQSFWSLRHELAAAGVDLSWSETDTTRLIGHALTGAVVFAGLAGIITGDPRTALVAGCAGGAVGAAVAVRRSYKAHLLGASRVRILTLQPC